MLNNITTIVTKIVNAIIVSGVAFKYPCNNIIRQIGNDKIPIAKNIVNILSIKGKRYSFNFLAFIILITQKPLESSRFDCSFMENL